MGYAETIQISANGAWCDTRSLNVLGTSVVTTRAWPRIAQVHDEEGLAASVGQPDYYIRELRQHAAELPADVFTFAQRLPATTPMYTYPMERDSVAAIPLRTSDEWWTRLPQETRKNARRAAKRGTEIRRALERRLGFVVYGKCRYGKQASTTLMEFKSRNGFEEFLPPRYYLPLTAVGTAGLRLRLYGGASDLVPAFALDLARSVRGAWNRGRLAKS